MYLSLSSACIGFLTVSSLIFYRNREEKSKTIIKKVGQFGLPLIVSFASYYYPPSRKELFSQAFSFSIGYWGAGISTLALLDACGIKESSQNS